MPLTPWLQILGLLSITAAQGSRAAPGYRPVGGRSACSGGDLAVHTYANFLGGRRSIDE